MFSTRALPCFPTTAILRRFILCGIIVCVMVGSGDGLARDAWRVHPPVDPNTEFDGSIEQDSSDEDDDFAEDAEPIEVTEAESALTTARQLFDSAPPAADERRERWLECESLFSDIVLTHADSPEAIEARYYRAECRRELGRPSLAREDYLSLIREDSRTRSAPHQDVRKRRVPAAQLGLGQTWVSDREWENALIALEIAARDDSATVRPQALYLLGICLRELGRFEDAKSKWSYLTRSYPRHRLATLASRSMTTLRPTRERLRDLMVEFQKAKKAFDKLPYRERRNGVRRVGRILDKFGDVLAPESEQILLGIFKDGDANLRGEVVAPLLRVAGPDGARFLLGQLDSLKPENQVDVLDGLQRHHLAKVDLEKIAPLLESNGPRVGAAALDALGRADRKDAADILVSAFTVSKRGRGLSAKVDQRNGGIARTLRGLRDEKAWAFLLDEILAQRRQSDGLRAVVAEAVGYARVADAGERLLQALPKSGPLLARAAVTSLGRLRYAPAVMPTVAQIDRRRTDMDFVRAAVETIAHLDPTPALEILLILSDSRDVGIRTLCVRALAKIDHPQARAQVVTAINDPAWQVRRSALRASRGNPSRELIDGLVARLPLESGALLPDLLRLLIAFTGQDYGPDPVAWKEYWDFARESYVAQGDATGDGKKSKTFVRKADADAVDSPTYFGVEIISTQVAFIVDCSGSMSARVKVESEGAKGDAKKTTEMTRIELARSELVGAIEKLSKSTRFNIVRFSSGFTSLSPKLLKLNRKTRRKALEFARGLGAGGGTNIYDSLESVLKAGEVDTIFLLSDGAPSAGKYTDTTRILEEVKRMNAVSQVTIHTISIGYDSPFMRRLAEENDGNAIVVGSNAN